MKYWSTLAVDLGTFQLKDGRIIFTCVCGQETLYLRQDEAIFHDYEVDVCTRCRRTYRMRVIVDVLQEYLIVSSEIVSAPRPETALEEEQVLNRHFRELLNNLAEHLPYTAKYSQVVHEAIRIIDEHIKQPGADA